MAHARGSIYQRRKLAERPHVVECPIPGGGLREITAMQAWCHDRLGPDGFVTSSRVDRAPDGMPQDVLRVHFAAEQDAQAFALAFGLPHPTKWPNAYGRAGNRP
jgi:hypothetical protein